MKLLAGLIANLKAVREGEDTLLDRTMVLYGSNFGDANAHVCTNMPVDSGRRRVPARAEPGVR